MPGIFEAVLLLLGLGAAVFIGGELWRDSRRRTADRENLDRLADGGVDRTVTMASRERTAPMSRELTFPLGGAEKTAPISDDDTRSRPSAPGQLESKLRCAGLELPAWAFVIAVGLLAAALAYGVWALIPQLPIAAVFAGLLAATIPFSMVTAAAHHRARNFLEKLVDAIDVMCAALDGGEPPANALATAAASAEEPAKRELREAHQRLQLGFSVRRSFQRMIDRYDSEGVRLITQTLIVKWQAGGDLSPVLRSVNQIVRDRLRQDRELRTNLAGAQASAILTAILPFLLLPFFLWKRPAWYYDLTHHPVGLQLLTGAILLQIAGFLWLRRLMRVEQ
jgi:tight adherence protein B